MFDKNSGNAFAANLKKLRKAKGLTQEDLGRALGVQKSCISNYEQNFSMPDIPRLLEIAEFFELSDLGQLVGYSHNSSVCENGGPNRNVPVVHTIKYGSLPVSTGNVIDNFTLPSFNLKTGDFIGVVIPDNSMLNAKLKKGDIAVIRRQPIVATGDIILVAIENQPPLLRKAFLMGNDVITLVPESDDSIYSPVTLDPQKDNFEIIGKVLYVYLTF